jgi:hypothetical protein
VYEFFNALAHFLGRLVGKRHGEDVVWCDAFMNQMHDAVCDNPGFA